MEERKFKVNGRECASYQLTDKDVVTLLEDELTTTDDKKALNAILLSRFKYKQCCKKGESRDEWFARIFSDFVNGEMFEAKAVAKKMATDHRYLQNEMFKVFFEYANILSNNFDKAAFDARNEWACHASKVMISSYNEFIEEMMKR